MERKQTDISEKSDLSRPISKAMYFSFGVPRYGSNGPRRLFVPQESSTSPAFLPALERPHAILRVVSSCQ
jgi:hypothetical protein